MSDPSRREDVAGSPKGGRLRFRRFRLPARRDPRGRRRLPFDLRKALFILPNAFTVSSIFCGLWAILEASTGADRLALYQAGIAIFFAAFFDMFDGRVARLTRTQSDFGVQMDSLADVISFGVAPSVLVYKWALVPLGLLGKLVAFSFAACGAIRLARFNVLASRGEGSSRYFVGLPIPMAAAMLVGLVIAHYFTIATAVQAHKSVLFLVVVLCYLMVSNVRYRTFKDFRPSLRTLPVIVLVLGAGFAVSLRFHPSAALVVFIGGYIFEGLLEEIIFFRRRRRERDAAAAEPVLAPETNPAA
ncbi:MAG: CDP-diacylglycerol--serine O-phosphatidyltransferase [Myxococcota bacterium]